MGVFIPPGIQPEVPKLAMNFRLPCEASSSDMYSDKYFTQRFKSSFVKFGGLVILNVNK